MHPVRSIAACAASFAITLLTARADYFELGVTPASRVFAGRVSVRMAFTNRGDETMRNVRPRVWFNDTWHTQPAYTELAPDASRTTEIDVGPAPALPGTYTAVVAMHYADRNGHPFTTVTTIPVYTGEPPDPEPLHASLPVVELRRRGSILLNLRSHADVPLQASCRLMLPDELGGFTAEPVSLELPPQGQTQHTFPLVSAWAVPGSYYRVFAIVDYVHAGMHISKVAMGGIRISSPRTLSARNARLLWFLPGGLCAWYVALQVRALRRLGRKLTA